MVAARLKSDITLIWSFVWTIIIVITTNYKFPSVCHHCAADKIRVCLNLLSFEKKYPKLSKNLKKYDKI